MTFGEKVRSPKTKKVIINTIILLIVFVLLLLFLNQTQSIAA